MQNSMREIEIYLKIFINKIIALLLEHQYYQVLMNLKLYLLMDIEALKQRYNYQAATQVMQQYLDVKFANFECIVLFRMGDFYELFYEDAVEAAKILGIALTKRGKTEDEEIPMCGVPFHALENYLHKLLEEGFKVAICEQMETPEEARKRGGYKAVVRREVTRIITPGTLTEDSLLDEVKPNYLASVVVTKNEATICYLDLSTSKFFIINTHLDQLITELSRIKPSEILISDKLRSERLSYDIEIALELHLSFQVDSFFAEKKCAKIIENYYNIASINSIGEINSSGISAMGSIIEYVCLTQKANLPKLAFPKLLNTKDFMVIDTSTRRSLELTSSANGGVRGSLFSVVNNTITKGGARLLYEYLSAPLVKLEKIKTRLKITDFFFQNIDLTKKIRKTLAKVTDLERAITRIQMQRGSPRDLLSIKDTTILAEQINAHFLASEGIILSQNLEALTRPMIGNSEIVSLISEGIREDAPNGINEGGIIKLEFHPKVKELQGLINNGRIFIEKLRDQYRRETGIDSLKISSNNVIGLFIDITSRNASKITHEKFIHRQTTANSVRYTTLELQELESKMLNARTCLIGLEKEIYNEICAKIINHSVKLYQLAMALSSLDVFTNFAFIAYEFDYCNPELLDDFSFNVEDGRHPVVERFLKNTNQGFAKNGCNLNSDKRIWLLTGPNMAGKSTFLRQNAVIAILAHIGSFVPAKSAKIGVIDKIFSRVGAGDDLTRGQSTFMVEMIETSAILNQSSNRSMIILDEVGRGTSTYDGVAIAWSVLEHIHDKIKARCLFATHYHELTSLENILPGLANYTIDIRQDSTNGKILFLHKIIKGFADRSYGVHVAEMAGLPAAVTRRANNLLAKFEKNSDKLNRESFKNESFNLSLFDVADNDHSRYDMKEKNTTEELRKNAQMEQQLDSEEVKKYKVVYDVVAKLDPNKLSPKEALDLVYKINEMI